ncbi:hypothetical protein JYT51_02035 [Candidatus Amoebophilus asiaticus]|nr:hypothetical protein [Candidatus Amoebophilus asiaticus]
MIYKRIIILIFFITYLCTDALYSQCSSVQWQIQSATTNVSCMGCVDGKVLIKIISDKYYNSPSPPYHITIIDGNNKRKELSEKKPKVDGLKVGTYQVEIIDRNRCKHEFAFRINESEPINKIGNLDFKAE